MKKKKNSKTKQPTLIMKYYGDFDDIHMELWNSGDDDFS